MKRDRESNQKRPSPWLSSRVKELRKKEKELEIVYAEEDGVTYAWHNGKRYHPFHDGEQLRKIIRQV